MIHRVLASQAASAFAVARSPVTEKDEDEEHEKRLLKMTRAGSPCSSGGRRESAAVSSEARAKGRGREGAVGVDDAATTTVDAVVVADDARSAGPLGAVATQLAADVINNCVRSFVYRCLRKKMARAQHEWKRWMEQRAHRML